MAVTQFPLLNIYQELRRRNFELGLKEFLDGLQAVGQSGQVQSRKDLSWACQALWATSLEEQRLVDASLNIFLPQTVTGESLEKMLQDQSRPLDSPTQTRDNRPTENRESKQPAPVSPQPDPGPQKSSENQHVSFDSLDDGRMPTQSVSAPDQLDRVRRFPIDFMGEMPVARRHMKRSWRYYRRMTRVGPATEPDIDATIQQIHRQGVLHKPVLVPRRRNQAEALLLMDQSASMMPFRVMTNELREVALQSGLAKVIPLYFHDEPGEYVFEDEALTKPVPLQDVLKEFHEPGVMIVSDAGAARGRLDWSRVERTRDFLESSPIRVRRLAWMNTVPSHRWSETTAGALLTDSRVKMFPLDRQGLDAAIDVLRGRVH